MGSSHSNAADRRGARAAARRGDPLCCARRAAASTLHASSAAPPRSLGADRAARSFRAPLAGTLRRHPDPGGARGGAGRTRGRGAAQRAPLRDRARWSAASRTSAARRSGASARRSCFFPVLGGLASGLFVQGLLRIPPAHGTNQMVIAFHRRDGVLPLRGPRGARARVRGRDRVRRLGGARGPDRGPRRGDRLEPRPRLRADAARAAHAARGGLRGGRRRDLPLPARRRAVRVLVLYRRPELEGSALVAAFIASAVGYATFSFVHRLRGLPARGRRIASRSRARSSCPCTWRSAWRAAVRRSRSPR